MNGAGLRFETMDHGGEYPDLMPQAIKLTDALGRSCIYVPITQNGRVVDSQSYALDRGLRMSEPMGWGTALLWGTAIVVVLIGLLVVAYLAFQNIIIAS